jgi:hypothetical protein
MDWRGGNRIFGGKGFEREELEGRDWRGWVLSDYYFV